jgi:hypothetical protein
MRMTLLSSEPANTTVQIIRSSRSQAWKKHRLGCINLCASTTRITSAGRLTVYTNRKAMLFLQHLWYLAGLKGEAKVSNIPSLGFYLFLVVLVQILLEL